MRRWCLDYDPLLFRSCMLCANLKVKFLLIVPGGYLTVRWEEGRRGRLTYLSQGQLPTKRRKLGHFVLIILLSRWIVDWRGVPH